MSLDRFFKEVATQSLRELSEIQESANSPAHWIVIGDRIGVERSRLPEVGGEIDVGSVLDSHLSNGCYAAAFVVHVSGHVEYLIAQVLIAEPRSFDIRRADIFRDNDGTRLGAWQYLI